MEVKFSEKSLIYFFILITAFAVCNPFSAKAQNISANNWAEGAWETPPFSIPDVTGSVTTRTIYFGFDRQGRVRAIEKIDKTGGAQQVNQYNGLTNQLELTYIPNLPVSTTSSSDGIYKITGKNISINLPCCSITAQLIGNSMQGHLTDKNTKKTEEWFVSKNQTLTNSSSRGTASGANNSTTENNNKIPDSPLPPATGTSTGFDMSAFEHPISAKQAREAMLEADRKKAEAERLFVGTWKYVEYYNDGKDYDFGVGKMPPAVKQSITLTFSKDLVWNSIYVVSVTEIARGNGSWVYRAENAASGTLEYYSDEKLIEKGNVKWINDNQFEYSLTFSPKNTGAIGNKYIFTR